MSTTVSEVLSFVRENDVKFIRLAFCDLFGRQKNISIMPQELSAALAGGASFDASAVTGFSDVSHSDLFLRPDPDTLALLPWRPQRGRVARFYCDILSPDGSPFERDPRGILRRALDRFSSSGYSLKAGAECEFYLFKTDENGCASYDPLDNGGYLDVSPLDKGENVRREICLDLERMGIQPESSHHEQGPGQNEIDFKFSGALACADNLVTFKTAVRTIAAMNGLFASFMPKPLAGRSGSGMHINISLFKNGRNVCETEGAEAFGSFIAGVLEKSAEITAFLNPIANSYERLGVCEAPRYISWSRENRSQLIRIPAANGERVRMELRSADPAANPYIALALIISAGLWGIQQGLKLPEPVNADLYRAETAGALPSLPMDLSEAVQAASHSGFAREVLGSSAFEKFIELKRREAADFCKAGDKQAFYAERYFLVI